MRKNNYKSGFTLLEALVAISILMVAVAAPITIAQKGLASAVYSKDQMTAAYLAQDVIEYIKNKRDQVSINNNFDWTELTVFSDCMSDVQPNGCQIDTIKNSPEISDDIEFFSDTNYLKKDTNGFYQYVNGDTTKFTRQVLIELKDINGVEDVALVTVNISWATDNLLTVKTLIYNY